MLQKIINYLILIDKNVTSVILNFLQQYELQTVEKDLVYTIPIFIKVAIYLLIFLLPLLGLKFIYPFMKSLHFIIMFVLFLITMSVFGIFIGFFQLLYS